MIHEFAHAIHSMGLRTIDPTFEPRLRKVYEDAKAKGLWKNTYAISNISEYWAEGVQSWFDTNRQNDSSHNHVDTRAELKSYDPALAKLVEEVFGDGPWRYVRPDKRTGLAESHLAGYEPGKGPRFQWEPELLEARRKNNANSNRSWPRSAGGPETGPKGMTAARVCGRSPRPTKAVPLGGSNRSRTPQSRREIRNHDRWDPGRSRPRSSLRRPPGA